MFQIVLGLMCPGGLCRGGKSQNEAKSRRFGMDMPSRAFYEGLIPKRFGSTLFWLLCGPSGRSVWHFSAGFPFPVFPMLHIRSWPNGFAGRCSRERASGDARYSLLGKRFLRRLRIIQLRIHINSCWLPLPRREKLLLLRPWLLSGNTLWKVQALYKVLPDNFMMRRSLPGKKIVTTSAIACSRCGFGRITVRLSEL